MMLEWIFSDLAEAPFTASQSGRTRPPTDESVEPVNSTASYFSWLLFGNVPPPADFGGTERYSRRRRPTPGAEVLYRIAMDRDHDYLQKDLKRTRRRWRYSDVLFAPIYKTLYVRKDYAVGSFQGGVSDSIQSHVWDVTWAVPNPRTIHNIMFSMHPESSSHTMQMYFADMPDPVIGGAVNLSKPSMTRPTS